MKNKNTTASALLCSVLLGAGVGAHAAGLGDMLKDKSSSGSALSGALGGGGGGVITTASHKCYFTGAPLAGSTNVTAKG